MAVVDAFVNSESHYFYRKKEMLEAIQEFHKRKGYFENVSVTINNLDQEHKGIDGLYLSVLGTSADSSDSGEVGRGNRVNQLISLMRPSGSEAAWGKNAVSHIGKIYNALCFRIADDIYRNVADIREVFVWMYNIIGNPVNKPKAIITQPITAVPIDRVRKEINDVVDKNLANINDFCKRLMFQA
jgi:S-adenosylmethionine synthetase